MKKLIAFFGLVSLGLGILGAFLPLLPTTPFILLSGALFARSSDRLHSYLLQHKVFGQIIRDYHENKSISLHAKIISLSTMWASILYAVLFVASGKIWLQVLLLCIAVGVSIHILRFKTRKKSVKGDKNPEPLP